MAGLDLASVEQSLKEYLLALARARGRNLSDLSSTDPLIEQGIFDSMSLLDFVVYAERLLAMDIPGEDVNPENFGSLGAIMEYLRERS